MSISKDFVTRDVDYSLLSGDDGRTRGQINKRQVFRNPQGHLLDGVVVVDSNGNQLVNNKVSTNNSTTAALGANETFTGTGEDISQYSAVSIQIFSDQASLVNGMQFQFSVDNINWDKIGSFTLAANTTRNFQYSASPQFFRFVFTNGTTDQTVFRVQTILHVRNILTTIHRISDSIIADNSAVLVKAVLTGLNPNNVFKDVKVNNEDSLQVSLSDPLTAFGDLRTAELSPQMQQSFEYTVDNTDLNINTVVSGGTVTQASGMAVMSTSTTSGSTALFQSKQHGKYRAALGGLIRFSFLSTTGVANTEQYIGLMDEPGSDRAEGTVELTGGGSGSVDGITVNSVEIMSGAVAFLTDRTVTARLVAANINAHTSAPNYSATSEGQTITITSDIRGTAPNAFVVTSSTTTITSTDVDLSGGTDGEAFKNGYGIGWNGSVFSMLRWQNNTLASNIPISSWDDPLDGSGDSGINIDQTKLNVFALPFQYLGGGAVPLFMEDPASRNGTLVRVHTIKYANANTEPSVHNPNFHFTMWTNNKATSSNIIIKSSSYGYFVEGKTSLIELHQPQNSTNARQKTSVVSEVAIWTIRNKTTYAGKTNFIDIVMERFSGSIDANQASNLGRVRLIKNAQLGGIPAFSDINTNNSVVEIDVSGTTVTGGTDIADAPLSGKNDKILENISDLKTILNPGDTITLAGSSQNSATMEGSGLWKELF